MRKIPHPPGIKRRGSQYPLHGGLNTVKSKICGAEEKLAKKSYLYPMTFYAKRINIIKGRTVTPEFSLQL